MMRRIYLSMTAFTLAFTVWALYSDPSESITLNDGSPAQVQRVSQRLHLPTSYVRGASITGRITVFRGRDGKIMTETMMFMRVATYPLILPANAEQEQRWREVFQNWPILIKT
jgi:hypothetical protein